jgi:hypothetical protein
VAQFGVFLWVRFRKKKNRIKIKKQFFFFPTGQANLQVQEMLRRSCGTDKKQKKKGNQHATQEPQTQEKIKSKLKLFANCHERR